MRVEHLHQWLHEAKQYDAPDATNWKKVVSVVQASFCDGMVDKESTWKTVVLISKGDSGDFQGIVLVEVIWKAVVGLLD